MNRRKLLIATTNPGKRREVLAVLDGLLLEFTTLADFAQLPPAVEDSNTFEGNAERKARHYAGLTGLCTLADDSGLEVDALGGAPGVHSARYAGLGADDSANNAKLQAELAKIPEEQRQARFRCVLVLTSAEQVLGTASGVLEGRIVTEPLGHNGFGYDPHFYLPDLGVTAAQLSVGEKNRISHRGKALRAMRRQIEELLSDMRRSSHTGR